MFLREPFSFFLSFWVVNYNPSMHPLRVCRSPGGWVDLWVGRRPADLKVVGLFASRGTCLGFGFGSRGACKMQPVDVSLSHPCFSCSLPLSLESIKKKKREVCG